MKKKYHKKIYHKNHQRLIFYASFILLFFLGIGLVLWQFQANLVFYYSPKDITPDLKASGELIRIGGLVKEVESQDDMVTIFKVDDLTSAIEITYQGILPNLFREGQGAVALGKFDQNGRFVAKEILAKHDENYMPPEVADAIKLSDNWQGK